MNRAVRTSFFAILVSALGLFLTILMEDKALGLIVSISGTAIAIGNLFVMLLFPKWMSPYKGDQP